MALFCLLCSKTVLRDSKFIPIMNMIKFLLYFISKYNIMVTELQKTRHGYYTKTNIACPNCFFVMYLV